MSAAQATQQEQEARIAEIICRIGNIATLDPEQDYFDAGLSSIQALELLLEVEAAFGATLSDDDFVKARTVRALAQLIATKGGEPQP